MRFGERLAAVIGERGPLCVGIDPHPGLLRQWGLPVDPVGLRTFSETCVRAFAGTVAVLKPQSAFFESHGSAGISVLEWVLQRSREAGAVTLLDVKRGDIGSTMDAYAAAYLADGAPLAADAITLSPYLGFGSLAPALRLAGQTGRGVFVLARTSNPEGVEVQESLRANGNSADAARRVSVAQHIVDSAAQCNAGAEPYGDVGVVVGATGGADGLDLTALNGPILAPGFGAQGAVPADLPARFGAQAPLVLPGYARQILAAGPDEGSLRDAATATLSELRAALGR